MAGGMGSRVSLALVQVWGCHLMLGLLVHLAAAHQPAVEAGWLTA